MTRPAVIYIAPKSDSLICPALCPEPHTDNCRYCDHLVEIPNEHLFTLSVLRKTDASVLVVCMECWAYDKVAT